MRLLVLDQFSDLGGAQQSLLDLLPEIRRRGWQALVGMPGNGEMFRRVRALGFDALPIACGPYGSGRKSMADAVRLLTQGPVLARQIRRMAREWRADLIYVNGPRLLPALTAVAPVVFHAHSYIAQGVARRLAGSALRRTGARVIANCEFVAQGWRAYVPPGRIAVVYNGVASPAAAAGSSSAHATIACIGRIAPQKGQLEFVQAAEHIHRTLPGARFAVIGASLFGNSQAARYEAAVRAAASHLPLEFRGWTGDIYRTLADIDLLLVPSDPHEATTRVILEAYAAGVPVVALRSGGVPEVVEHGDTGFLAGSVRELAQCAIDLLRDPGLRASMSRNARALWTRRFTLPRYRSEVLALLARAAAGETMPPRQPPEPPLRPASIHIRRA